MTNVINLSALLLKTVEKGLTNKGFVKTFSADGIGSMWQKNDITVDITVFEGVQNTLIVVDPYIVVRINDDPTVIHTVSEIEELFKIL